MRTWLAGVQGSPCRGFGGVPQYILTYHQRGAGVSLPGVWGCPPIYPYPIPKGCRGLPAGGWGCPPIIPFFPSLSCGERGRGEGPCAQAKPCLAILDERKEGNWP